MKLHLQIIILLLFLILYIRYEHNKICNNIRLNRRIPNESIVSATKNIVSSTLDDIFLKGYKKEHFLNMSDETYREINETVNKTLIESLIKNTTSCQNTISSNQIIDIECDASPETLKRYNELNETIIPICVDAKVKIATDVGQEIDMDNFIESCTSYACVSKDLEQESVISFTGTCTVDNKMTEDIQNDMKQSLEDKLDNEEDGFTKAINTAVENITNFGDSGSTTTEVRNSLLNDFKSVATTEILQEMINQFSSNQAIKIKSTGGSLDKGISQRSRMELTTDLLVKNENYKSVLNKIDSSLKKDVKNVEKGFTHIWETTNESFKAFIYATGGVIALIGIALIVGLVNFLKSDSGKMAISESSKVAQKAIDAK